MTAVIEAASAGVKDMADGSLRITFEFDPRHAAEAFALFGPRGRAVAIAALKDGTGAMSSEMPESKPNPPVPKGGEWAKLAGMWCADPDFWRFMNERHPGDRPITNAEQAASHLRVYCDIDSRAVLDSDPEALVFFKHSIRHPFMEWMKKNGVRK